MGDRPPHDEKTRPGYRSARACPSQGTEKNASPGPVARGTGPRKAPQPLHIKVLSDLFSAFLLMSIDIQVLSDLAFILQILHILAILLQTTKKARREK